MADMFTEAVEAGASGRPMFSQEGLDVVKTFEGFNPNTYYDLDNKKKLGKLTVGYGFTDYDIPGLREGYSIDKNAAEKMLPDLLNKKYGPAVLNKVKVPLNDQQYSALTSLVYNIGPTNFGKSTLLKKLNEGDYSGAAEQFKVWNKAGGKTLEGLVRRRDAESALFQGDMSKLVPILERQKFGIEGLSQTSTPVPSAPALSPEEAGEAAAYQVAEDIGKTPEQRGSEAAQKIADEFMDTKKTAVVETKEKAADTDLMEKLLTLFKESQSAKEPDKEEEEEPGIAFASTTSFSGAPKAVQSGLPRASGLGRKS